MKDKEEILKEFETNYIAEWRWEREQPFKPSASDWLSEKLDLAYQQGKADKAREVEEIIKGKIIYPDLTAMIWLMEFENGLAIDRDGAVIYNQALSDIKQELKSKE